jgi:hypothetical protein
MIPASVVKVGVVVSAVFGAFSGVSPSMAQQAASDVAYVEAVSGRVVAAAARGTPALVESLDVISDRTRFDLLPNSELRLCHYHTRRFVTVTGPARVTVSADGLTIEAGKEAEVSQEACGFALASKFQGGFIARGVSQKK